MFKFEKLEIYKRSLAYVDLCYMLAEQLPDCERYNLTSQLRRAATSVSLNIAEGSTGQSDAEQARFLSLALRSLLETVACQQIVRRRGYTVESTLLDRLYQEAEALARQIQAMRRAIAPWRATLREEFQEYVLDES